MVPTAREMELDEELYLARCEINRLRDLLLLIFGCEDLRCGLCSRCITTLTQIERPVEKVIHVPDDDPIRQYRPHTSHRAA